MLDERIGGADPRFAGPLERILYLKRLPVIGTLPGTQLALIAEHLRERLFPKGAVLLREGEPVPAVFFPIEGSVRMVRRGRDLGLVAPGGVVGGLGVLAPDEHGIGAVAAVDTLVFELSARTLFEIFEDHFAILNHVMREIARRLIDLFRGEGVDPPFPPPQPSPPVPDELDLVDRIFFVRRFAPFPRASVNALAELSRGLTETRFAPGTVLWREGEAPGWGSLVVSGALVCHMEGGRRFRAGPGAALGTLESVARVPRWYEPVTETPVVALQGNVQGLLDALEDNFEMAMDYVAVMARLLGMAYEAALMGEEAGGANPLGAAPAPE